ncbi:MAG: DUF5658 family protein [Methanoregula sp.]|jgi:hypothetical protein|nr:DUF5658 family protein [Methanoregula sp.]
MTAQEHRSGILAGNPVCRPANEVIDRRITEFSLILAALFLLDIITTELILRLGGIELNPLMAGVVTSPLVHLAIKAGTLLLIIIVSHFAESKVKGSAIAFYCVIITHYVFVIVNNMFVLIPHVAGL